MPRKFLSSYLALVRQMNGIRPYILAAGSSSWSAGTLVGGVTGFGYVAQTRFGSYGLTTSYDLGLVFPFTTSGGVVTLGTGQSVCAGPAGVAIAPNRTDALVCSYSNGTVTPGTFSAGVWSWGSALTLSGNALGVQISPTTGANALVACYSTGQTYQLNLTGGIWSVGTVLSTGTNPRDVQITSDGQRAVVIHGIGGGNGAPLTLVAGDWTITGSSFGTGTNSYASTFFDNGSKLLTCGLGSTSVGEWQFVPATGTYTQISSTELGFASACVVMAPDNVHGLITGPSGTYALLRSGSTLSVGSPLDTTEGTHISVIPYLG